MAEAFRMICGAARGVLTALRTIKPRNIQYKLLAKPPGTVTKVRAAKKSPSRKLEKKTIRCTSAMGSRLDRNNTNGTSTLTSR